jgi:hypothetical protein
MNRAFIPLAAAVTFVAVYQLTPVPAPVAQAVEPAAVTAVAASPVEAVKPAAFAVKRPSARPRASRRRRAAASAPPATVRAARRATFVYYSGCNEVRAAGLAPLFRGQPGYRPEMDGDDDGIACEPHRGRGRSW